MTYLCVWMAAINIKIFLSHYVVSLLSRKDASRYITLHSKHQKFSFTFLMNRTAWSFLMAFLYSFWLLPQLLWTLSQPPRIVDNSYPMFLFNLLWFLNEFPSIMCVDTIVLINVSGSIWSKAFLSSSVCLVVSTDTLESWPKIVATIILSIHHFWNTSIWLNLQWSYWQQNCVWRRSMKVDIRKFRA